MATAVKAADIAATGHDEPEPIDSVIAGVPAVFAHVQ